MLARSSIGPIGVDLAAGGVKLLQLRTARGGRVELVAAARLHAGPDDARLAAELRATLAWAGFRGDSCVVGLPRGDFFVGAIRVPGRPVVDAEASARLHAARCLGVPAADLEIEMTPTGAVVHGAAAGQSELLVTAVPRASVNRRLAAFGAAGLRPLAVEDPARAILRGLGAEPGVRAVLDIGASGAMLVIAHGTGIVRVRAITTGMADIERAVRRRLGGDAAVARHVARMHRADVEAHPAVTDAVRPLAHHIASETRLALRSYGASFRGPGAACVVVTGGGVRIPRVHAIIEEVCGIPAVNDGTADTLGPTLGAAQGEPASAWAAAAGLAARRTGAVTGNRRGRLAA